MENRGSGELLTVEQAAARMSMSVRHVRRLVGERRIAFHKLGRAVRLSPADVDAYVSESRVEPILEEDVWRDIRGVA